MHLAGRHLRRLRRPGARSWRAWPRRSHDRQVRRCLRAVRCCARRASWRARAGGPPGAAVRMRSGRAVRSTRQVRPTRPTGSTSTSVSGSRPSIGSPIIWPISARRMTPMTMAQPTPADAPVLRLSRSFAAPRDRVFRAFTAPAQLARWWGPKGFTVPACTLDVRVGGAWRTVMRSPEGQGSHRERRLSGDHAPRAPGLHLGVGGGRARAAMRPWSPSSWPKRREARAWS